MDIVIAATTGLDTAVIATHLAVIAVAIRDAATRTVACRPFTAGRNLQITGADSTAVFKAGAIFTILLVGRITAIVDLVTDREWVYAGAIATVEVRRTARGVTVDFVTAVIAVALAVTLQAGGHTLFAVGAGKLGVITVDRLAGFISFVAPVGAVDEPIAAPHAGDALTVSAVKLCVSTGHRTAVGLISTLITVDDAVTAGDAIAVRAGDLTLLACDWAVAGGDLTTGG